MNAAEMFAHGETPTLEEVLLNRERRVHFIEELLYRFPLCCVISLKCNIPGPIKSNGEILALFEYGVTRIQELLLHSGWKADYHKRMNLRTGPEAFWVISGESLEVKQQMILFEEETLGRLFDADVLVQKEGLVQTRSRVELGYEPRRCLICNEDARTCASRRIHPVTALQQKLAEQMLEYADELEKCISLPQ
ncbi:MAG: citrate lyase holo-[acyl-carrier protein] synthase [Clostridium sp.]|uniref:citrate lyase holo-[acyl-carrier protein] synthase n=1 Tax=Clostridium sp. TaxID=1506 RepID=UPI00290B9EAB|nr:citrate lyase holo-[acyl-carrier protein] synthase [Clostridium sp.]MDU7338290.1 citrate lyase holo-[acyl-carrier protein] synthase [Clostridium sp.]